MTALSIPHIDDHAKIVVGNWKMNGKRADASREISRLMSQARALRGRVQLVICPPVTTLSEVASLVDSDLVWAGAQDCMAEPCGARTGDVNAELIHDAGAKIVILGHSERRSFHQESDAVIRAKIKATWDAGMVAVLCVGETKAQRDAGMALAHVCAQIGESLPKGATSQNTIIAYEPVWAIGTGEVPTTVDILAMVTVIRSYLALVNGDTCPIKILYGGSVSASNARGIMTEAFADGLLVGKASLKSEDFMAIAKACAITTNNSGFKRH